MKPRIIFLLILGVAIIFACLMFFLPFNSAIEIITSFGTLLAGVAALYSLLEIEKQKRATYQPTFIIPCPIPYLIYWENKNQMLNFKFSPEWLEMDFSSPPVLPPKKLESDIHILLYNIGLGTAKSVRIDWSFDLDSFADIIRSIYQFPVEIKGKRVIFGKLDEKSPGDHIYSIFSFMDEEKLISYIHPTNLNPDPWTITIPSAYTEFLALYSLFVANNLNSTEIKHHVIPPLKVTISYEDIGDEKYIKEYHLGFQVWPSAHKQDQLAINGSIEMVGHLSHILSSYDSIPPRVRRG